MIQWYVSGTDITCDAIVQTKTCNYYTRCNETVITSSLLVYIGHITDNGKTMYCRASNIDGRDIRSQDRAINVLCMYIYYMNSQKYSFLKQRR